MSEPAELKLPLAAAELWARIRSAVDSAMTSLGDEPTGYRIGGGTILAARWEHRESYDIDLAVAEDTPLGKLREEKGDQSGFEAKMRALRGVPEYFPNLKLWRVAFDNGQQGLDLWAHKPLLGAGEEELTIEGRRETVLSTVQILRGKLERADKHLPRDVFDVIKAGTNDPRALEGTVNAIDEETAERIAMSWYWNGGEIAKEAGEKLLGVPENERIDPRKLGTLAAHAIKNAVYTHCRIETRDSSDRGENGDQDTRRADDTNRGARGRETVRGKRTERLPGREGAERERAAGIRPRRVRERTERTDSQRRAGQADPVAHGNGRPQPDAWKRGATEEAPRTKHQTAAAPPGGAMNASEAPTERACVWVEADAVHRKRTDRMRGGEPQTRVRAEKDGATASSTACRSGPGSRATRGIEPGERGVQGVHRIHSTPERSRLGGRPVQRPRRVERHPFVQLATIRSSRVPRTRADVASSRTSS